MTSSEIRNILNTIFTKYPDVSVSYNANFIILQKDVKINFAYYRIGNCEIEYLNIYRDLEELLKMIAVFLNNETIGECTFVENLDVMESNIIYYKYDQFISLLISEIMNECDFRPDRILFYFLDMYKMKISIEKKSKNLNFVIEFPILINDSNLEIVKNFVIKTLKPIIIIVAIPFFCDI